MLKKKRQREEFDQRWKAVRLHLRAYAKTGRPEELHDLRVAVKKIRALFLLQAAKEREKLKAHFKPVKKVFRKAGDIRAAQLHLQLAKKYHFNDLDFKVEQEKIVRDGEKQLRKKAGAYEKKMKDAGKFVRRHLDDVEPLQLGRIFSNEIRFLDHTFQRFKQAELHESRKRVKGLLYLQAVLPQPLVALFHFNKVYLDRLQELLGEWHDLNLLGAIVKERKGKAALVKRLHTEETGLLRKLRVMVKDFSVKCKVPMPADVQK